MEICRKKFVYDEDQEDLQSRLHTISGFIITAALLLNLFGIAFVLKHPFLRQNNIFSLKLFFYNTGECIFTLIALIYTHSTRSLISDAKSFRFFFLLGEVMAVGLIIGHKINLAGGTMNSVSNITRNPAEKDIRKYFDIPGKLEN